MMELDRQLSPNESVLRTTVMSEDGPAPTETRPLDRLPTFDERSGLMAIVHDPALTVARTPDISPHARLDGCPECVVNTEPPRSVTALAAGFRAAYLCNDCGHAWTTDWKD